MIRSFSAVIGSVWSNRDGGASAPVFKDESIESAEVFGVVSDDGPSMTQSGGGDQDIGDADRRALVEQSGVETGGDTGTCGIEGEDLQGGDEAHDFGAFVLAMFRRCAVCALEEFELGDDRYKAVFRAACSQPRNDLFPATQHIDADVGIEDALHSIFST
jgi:hypothetical protein